MTSPVETLLACELMVIVPFPWQMTNVSHGSWLWTIVLPPGSTTARLAPKGVRSISSHG